jgi:hypothetical protein
MSYKRTLVLSMLGIGVIAGGFVVHNRMARTARLEHVYEPLPYFPVGAIWTHSVIHDPVDPRSSTIINWLENAGGWGTGQMRVDFGMRVMEADWGTVHVPFHKGSAFYANDSDVIPSFPLPAGGGAEGQKNYHCPTEHEDCHLIVVDRRQHTLYEAFEADEKDGTLYADYVGLWDLSRVYPLSGRGEQCTSADAAGFPIAPLLFNADELAVGRINHAIRFVLPNPRIRAHVYVHPASHAGGPAGPDTAPPYGAHFRLKASYDLSQLKPAARVVAKAMQKYGMFLSDGGSIALTAQNDADTTAKYSDVGFTTHDLKALKVSDFEVLELGPIIPLTYGCARNP